MSRSGRPPQAAPSLDVTTKLGRVERAGWLLWLYPQAGEASGVFRPVGVSSAAMGAVPATAERSAIEAARRAGGKVRRYCAANRLNKLGTLTYTPPGCYDPRQVRGDVAEFWRSLRDRHQERFPYLWTAEWHPGGHGLHVHFAVGRFILHRWIDAAWGRGFVHITLLGDLPAGSGSLGEARMAARYLAKYISKAPGAGDGLHRYEVAQGFQPRRELIEAPTALAALDLASGRLHAEPTWVWWSRDAVEWHGPPAVWASWNA